MCKARLLQLVLGHQLYIYRTIFSKCRLTSRALATIISHELTPNKPQRSEYSYPHALNQTLH